MTRPVLHALSLGLGVQSVTLQLMAEHGEITPRPDVAIFANLHEESQPTYETLAWLKGGNVSSIPVVEATRGGLGDALRDAVLLDKVGVSNPPFYSITGAEKGQLRRKCSRDYKVRLIQATARRIYEERYGKVSKGCIVQWIGITSDEAIRFTTSSPAYIKLRYPFLERASDASNGSGLWMSRSDCIAWLKRHDYPVPAKSACVFCPYRSNENWRWLRDNDPIGWDRALKIDATIRNGLPGTKADALFVHRDCVPLAEADLEIRHRGPDMFSNDCSGMCGV